MTPTHACDIAVLGAGPAGATVALELARRGRDVTLIEATNFDSPRFGETLPPEINPLLRTLGLWERFLATTPLDSPGTISVWNSPIPEETDFIMNPHGNGWHVDRNRFDSMLCAAAGDAGAHIKLGTHVLSCTCDADSWRIRVRSKRREEELRARFVIDAGGRNMIRLAENDGRIVHDTVIAIVLTLRYDIPPQDQRTLIESIPAGWWYVTPLPSGQSIAMLFCDPEFYNNEGIIIAEHLESAPLTRARLQSAHIADSRVVHVSSSIRKTICTQHWAALGDAAASYDPLSGYGITKALQHARLLAEALTNDTLDAYATHVRQAFTAYIPQRQAFYASASHVYDHFFWKKRCTARIGKVDEQRRHHQKALELIPKPQMLISNPFKIKDQDHKNRVLG